MNRRESARSPRSGSKSGPASGRGPSTGPAHLNAGPGSDPRSGTSSGSSSGSGSGPISGSSSGARSGPSSGSKPVLKPGDLVHLDWKDGRAPIPAQIATMDEGLLTLTTPSSADSRASLLVPGQALHFVVGAGDVSWVFAAKVIEVPRANVFKVRLEENPPEPVQRREYFRMAVSFPLLLPLPRADGILQPAQGVPYVPPVESAADYQMLRIINLSAGGCMCRGVASWLRPAEVYRGFLYPGDEQGPLALQLLLIRKGPEGEGHERTAFQFVGLKARARERILRALFREYRRRRAMRLESA